MPRSSTSSFVTELELTVSSQQERELLARFQAAINLYNACLSECMKRVHLVRNSELYQKARSLPKAYKKQRSEAFLSARKADRYSEYELHSFANVTAKSAKWIKDKLDANTIQKIATRAFQASERVLLGRAQKVRFKVPSRFKSVEGKSNKAGIRWKEHQVIWSNLKLAARINWEDPVITHGLNSRVKYCRLLFRFINGKRRWFVQLVNEGQAYQKPKNYVTDAQLGIDLNVSTVAVVGDDYAELMPFCLKVSGQQKEISQLQRKMDRSKRKHNPDNYEPDFQVLRGRKIITKKGKNKKGKFKWKFTKAYRKLRARSADIQRRQSAHRKSEQRQLVNLVLRHGNQINMENVSVKAWQKIWGKAIKSKAPGFFQSELSRKAENANGIAVKFPTRNTKLSQTCICGRVEKKPLSQRVHSCGCGIRTHRDLISGFLARHVQSGELSMKSARDGWLRSESILETAWQRYEQKIAEQVSESESRKTDSPSEAIVSKSAQHRKSETAGYTKPMPQADGTPSSLDMG